MDRSRPPPANLRTRAMPVLASSFPAARSKLLNGSRRSFGRWSSMLRRLCARQRYTGMLKSHPVSAGAKIPITPVKKTHPLRVTNRPNSGYRGGLDVLRGRDVDEVAELKRQGLGIRAISRMTV